jgi:hypothetical protein
VSQWLDQFLLCLLDLLEIFEQFHSVSFENRHDVATDRFTVEPRVAAGVSRWGVVFSYAVLQI